MERNDYSNCPLKKRPFYIIKEEVEHENGNSPIVSVECGVEFNGNIDIPDDAPVDLSSTKRRLRTEWGSSGAIDFTKSKLPSIKEEEFNHSSQINNENQEDWYGKELRIDSSSYDNMSYEGRPNRLSSVSVEHSGDSVSLPIYMSNGVDNNNLFKNPVQRREDSVSPPIIMSNRVDNRNLFKNPYRNFNNNVISRDLHYQDHQNPQGPDHLLLSPSSSHISYSSNPSELGDYSEPEDLSVRSKKKVLVPSDSSVNIQKHRKDFSEPESHDLYYQCRSCNKCYSTYAGLVKHQQCHAIPNEARPTETEYKTISLSGSDYVKTKNNVENNNTRLINHPRYQCKDCGKSYSTYSGLTKHQQFHCPSAEGNQVKKLFSCKNCEKVYVSLGALKMHIRTHTLPCKCPLCGKAFSRPWLLQGHIRTHTGEKPFSCQHCHRAFADRSNLRAHLQTHSDVKKYSCTSCTKTFSRMSLLGKHLQGGCPGVASDPHAYGSEYTGQTYYEEGKQIVDSSTDSHRIAYDGNPGTRHDYSMEPLYKEDVRVF